MNTPADMPPLIERLRAANQHLIGPAEHHNAIRDVIAELEAQGLRSGEAVVGFVWPSDVKALREHRRNGMNMNTSIFAKQTGQAGVPLYTHAAPAQPAVGWQPIEAAPEDERGPAVLIYNPARATDAFPGHSVVVSNAAYVSSGNAAREGFTLWCKIPPVPADREPE